MTFPLIIVNFNNFFVQPAPGFYSDNFALASEAPEYRYLEGGRYSYIRVLPNSFLLKSIVFTVCEHESLMNICPRNYRYSGASD
jgi:hypothetical protein